MIDLKLKGALAFRSELSLRQLFLMQQSGSLVEKESMVKIHNKIEVSV